MKVTLLFVPPGGGENDYSLDFELPGVPQPGDYISITRPDTQGTADFIVRRVWWHLHYPSSALYKPTGDTTHGTARDVMVECEFAIGAYSSPGHLRSCEAYKARKGEIQGHQASGY